MRDHQLDPEMLVFSVGPLPFPATAIVCEEGTPVKTSLRLAKTGRGLDRCPLLAKTNPLFWEGGWELWPFRQARLRLPLVAEAAANEARTFQILLDRDRPSPSKILLYAILSRGSSVTFSPRDSNR